MRAVLDRLLADYGSFVLRFTRALAQWVERATPALVGINRM